MIYGDTNNIEYMCQECNSLRAAAGHCWGALAAMLAIDSNRARVGVALQRWASSQDMAPPGARRGTIPQRAPLVPRKPVIYRDLSREFIYPADTAAKRVWNLATLKLQSVPMQWHQEKERRLALPDAERKVNY